MPPWRERIFGSPEAWELPALTRALGREDPSLRARAARALAERPEPEAARPLPALLQDPIPAVRRAAALGLGLRKIGLEVLLSAAAKERCTTVLLALLAASVRAGGPLTDALARVEAHGGRTLQTARGPRAPEAAVGFGPHVCRQELLRLLDPRAVPDGVPRGIERAALRSELAALIDRDPAGAGRQALEDLAAQAHPADLARFDDKRAGRRGGHSQLIARGLHGDPRSLPMLLDQLDRMDVDPGRGFAQRRFAAVAIGRLGLPTASERLVRALETEALEHEGRPGAGLGIQYPVRTNLLWALGEVQAFDAAKVLCGYLGNLHGSALGGFHLPAMGALWKLGAPAVPPLVAVARGEGEAAINAVGVLEALGAREALEAVAAGHGAAAEAARALL